MLEKPFDYKLFLLTTAANVNEIKRKETKRNEMLMTIVFHLLIQGFQISKSFNAHNETPNAAARDSTDREIGTCESVVAGERELSSSAVFVAPPVTTPLLIRSMRVALRSLCGKVKSSLRPKASRT